MDLLSKRYANPYILIDEFIKLGQFRDFSHEIMKTIAEEKKEEIRWQFYLHKVWEMTYEEYLSRCDSKPETHKMNDEQIKDVLQKSMDILEGFTV